MKIIAVADIHGETNFIEKIGPTLGNANLAIVAGDITHFGGKDDATRIIESIKIIQPNVYAIPGNCDRYSVSKYLDSKNINLHGRITDVNGMMFVGIGFSGPTLSKTPSELSRADYDKLVDKIDTMIPEDREFILVSHVPPLNTACDILFSGRHVGSKAVRLIIEKKKPLVCICGHIHESSGIDKIGNTFIMNPGDAAYGGFGWIDFSCKPIKAILKNKHGLNYDSNL